MREVRRLILVADEIASYVGQNWVSFQVVNSESSCTDISIRGQDIPMLL